MNPWADKGALALATIQRQLHIKPEETMAFGDNFNDMGMLKNAGESYAMANAHPKLKEAAKHIAPPVEEQGVLPGDSGAAADSLRRKKRRTEWNTRKIPGSFSEETEPAL